MHAYPYAATSGMKLNTGGAKGGATVHYYCSFSTVRHQPTWALGGRFVAVVCLLPLVRFAGCLLKGSCFLFSPSGIRT